MHRVLRRTDDFARRTERSKSFTLLLYIFVLDVFPLRSRTQLLAYSEPLHRLSGNPFPPFTVICFPTPPTGPKQIPSRLARRFMAVPSQVLLRHERGGDGGAQDQETLPEAQSLPVPLHPQGLRPWLEGGLGSSAAYRLRVVCLF